MVPRARRRCPRESEPSRRSVLPRGEAALAALLAALVLAGSPGPAAAEEQEGASVAHRLLLYVPNRMLDLLDPIRLRVPVTVRVGP